MHAEFVVDPDFCPVVYSYEETKLQAGDSAIILPDSASVLPDVPQDRTFTFSYSKDLEPLGQTQTVTVTATSTSKHGIFSSMMRTDQRTF